MPLSLPPLSPLALVAARLLLLLLLLQIHAGSALTPKSQRGSEARRCYAANDGKDERGHRGRPG
eukprot:10009568-Heterocapsa_arctica.AAC.1